MSFKDWVMQFFRRSGPGPSEYSPVDLDQHIVAAYKLLSDATKSAIQIPSNIVDVIVKARTAAEARKSQDSYTHSSPLLAADLEVDFWNAYGLLNSSIRPAEGARRRYRQIFYVVLVVLLAGQFFFLVGDHVRSKLADLDKQIVDIRGRAAAPNATAAPGTVSSTADLQIEQLEKAQTAYIELSRSLLEIAGGIANYPLKFIGLSPLFATNDSSALIIKGKLDVLLVFLSGYLLPMMYGLLGACAFVLRQLSVQGDKLTYAHNARVQYSLRLNIGLLSGLAVSWFIKPGVGDATLVSLSPLALAFIAGYGSDLFFVALDKVVQAFTPAPGAAGKAVGDETANDGVPAKAQGAPRARTKSKPPAEAEPKIRPGTPAQQKAA
ncbi:MAG: hypothetical protein QOG83_3256 [Alphaproteobacteria bacterium]|nr:hypothetical protein [Alphaproteobacteria bacterium]